MKARARQERAVRALPQLAPAELDVTKALWSSGALSGRGVDEKLETHTGWAYSTTRTMIQRMVKNGLVTKRRFHGLHVYEPAIPRALGMARLVRGFASRVLGLSDAPVAALFQERERRRRSRHCASS